MCPKAHTNYMVRKGHPAYAEQLAQQATLATIKAEVRQYHIDQTNAADDARHGLVKCSDCGCYLQHITDTDER